MHQVIVHVLVTKDIDTKAFYYIYPWGETLAYIAWVMMDYYHCTIQATPGQYLFFSDMIFNLMSVVD